MNGETLKGQIALVTGAASGIGAGVARALGAAGASVAINYVTDPDAAEAVAGDVQSLGGKAMTLRADVSREDDVRGGTIDVLVNNAGLQKDAPFTDMTLAQWNTVIGVNLTGMFLCSREATREMVRRGIRVDVSRADNFDRLDQSSLTAEHLRLEETAERTAHWRRWGPYLADRQWGTVREDYSANGKAWDYFPHDHSRSRAYRWGEDGILGISDNHQRLCFAPSQPSEPWSAGRSSDRLGTARTRPGALRIARSAGPMTRRPKGNPA